MNTWPRHIPDGQPTIYWFKVPMHVMERLRPLGFHNGYNRINGTTSLIKQAIERSTDDSEKARLLYTWSTYVDREASLLTPGYPTLWYPKIGEKDEVLVKTLFGERLIIIEASTFEEAMHKFFLTPWNFAVFYHVACMGNWKCVIEEQLGLLEMVGLSGVYLSFLGKSDDLEYFRERARFHSIKISLQYQHSTLEMFEIPALKLIQDWAENNKDGYMLYFHTKGVSNPKDVYKILWRRLMQRCVVNEWKANAEYLRAGADVVGHFWQRYPLIDHVPGNFWMARASYINKLEDFTHYCQNPRHPSLRNLPRFSAEFWLGSAIRDPIVHSHIPHGSGIDRPSFWSTPRLGTSGYLALCLWCKNEGSYLPEWLDYHLHLGVEHVFIVDNNSSNSLQDHILRYIADGKVTLLYDDDTRPGRQCRAYLRCLKEFGSQYDWLGFIDTDEFIVPKVHQTLPELLHSYEAFGGLGIFWYCFGSSGLKRRPKSTLRSFVKRSHGNFGSNDHIKSIVQPKYVADIVPPTPHNFIFKEGYYCVDEDMQPIASARRKPRVSEKVQINHYITRSQQECEEKMLRGPGNAPGTHRSTKFFEGHDSQCNRVFDESAVVVLDRIRG